MKLISAWLLVASSFFTLTAYAQEVAPMVPDDAPPPPRPRDDREDDAPIRQRVFGLGTGIGAGFGAVSVTSTGSSVSGVAPLITLPTIEAQIFIPDTDQFSIDLSLPITNMIIASVALEGVYVQMDAFFNFNPGERNIRLVAGPGIGFDAVSYGSYSYGGIRGLGVVGLEVLTDEQGFSFKVLARPYFEVYLGSLVGDASAFGGGATAMLSFSGNVVE